MECETGCLCAVGMDPPLFNLHSFPSSLILVLLLLLLIVAGFLMLFAYAKECRAGVNFLIHTNSDRRRKREENRCHSIYFESKVITRIGDVVGGCQGMRFV